MMELLHRFLTLFSQDVIVTVGVERQCKQLLERNLCLIYTKIILYFLEKIDTRKSISSE